MMLTRCRNYHYL